MDTAAPNEPTEGQQLLVQRPIDDELQVSYLDYAMSVIVGRALPDVRDGLKPVHRRILYAMNELSLKYTQPYKKCARIVGEVLGKYHPHGDQSVYDALVRMGQDFSMRFPLVQGQGNFGSLDGDPPAAMRYCVTGDTLILTDAGMLPIESLSDAQEEEIDIGILSIDGKQHRASRFFDSGTHPTIKIETANGFSLEGSHNHPIMTWSVGKDFKPSMRWKTLVELEKGDVAVLNRGHELFAEKSADLRKYHPVAGYRNHIKLPDRMNDELAFLLGALVSEGCFHQRQVIFCNSHDAFFEKVKECAASQFPGIQFYETETKGGCRQFSIYEQRVVRFLINIGLEEVKSAHKKIPFTVLRSTRESVRAFLIALFEGDGSIQSKIDKRHGGRSMELFYVSKSKELVQQLKTVLLNFGICSNIVNIDKRNGCSRLVISSAEHVGLFNNLLGFFSQRKGQLLTSVQEVSPQLSKTDFIPFLNDYFRMKYSSYLFDKHNFGRYLRLESSSRKVWRFLDEEDRKLIRWLLKHHYLFSPIESITYDAKGKSVFSVKVDSDCHSFVANGFINHNTEARLARVADEMLQDIDKETVRFVENFDGSLTEPSVLPAKLPNLLVNGSSGIAVGMATNIPPHNLAEVAQAAAAYIENPDIEMFDLARIMPGPDFPTGGIIQGKTGIMQYFNGGRGKLRVRAVLEREERAGRKRLIITEIPYMVNKADLVKEIADAVKAKKIDGISDILDESDRKGMRVVIELKQAATPEVVENLLFHHTRAQTTFGVNMVCLVDGRPRTVGVKEVLEQYLCHRKIIVRKRTEFDLSKALDKEHLLEGLVIALDNIDAIVDFLKKTTNVEAARQGLIANYSLSEKQASAILEMRLSRLTGLEQEKIRKDLAETRALITELKGILASEERILAIIKDELQNLAATHTNERRTQILEGEETGLDLEDLIEPEDVVVTISNDGYCKRIPVDTYTAQHRGGKGIIGTTTKDEDFVRHLFVANTHTWLLVFTDKGRCYWTKAYAIPEGSRQAKGRPIINVVSVAPDERVRAVIPVKEFSDDKHLLFVTRNGLLKKTVLSAYGNVRQTGIIALNLLENDNLIDVLLTAEKDTVFVASAKGMAVRCSGADVRPMGRNSTGVRGIRLVSGDRVVDALVLREDTSILSVTEHGYGKRTRPDEYRHISRGGKGVINIITSERNGDVVACKAVRDDQDIMLMSRNGITIRTPVTDVRIIGRNTQGVKIMNLRPGDSVVACTVTERETEEISESPSQGVEDAA